MKRRSGGVARNAAECVVETLESVRKLRRGSAVEYAV
jgi:hypothetical protein